jgi:predicted enzyme related to lactoylglutathione lyase
MRIRWSEVGEISNSPPLIPELDAADLDRSLAFYAEVFGFRVTSAARENASLT